MNLRKLTRKSVIGFGKHEFLTIQHLLDLKKTQYLRWVYYNCSQIDFFDDILEEIGCLEYKIPKPSVDKELNEYVNTLADMRKCGLSKLKNNAHIKRVKKGSYITFVKYNQNEYFKKANLMAKNRWK